MSKLIETELGILPSDWSICTIEEVIQDKGIAVGVMYPGEDTEGGVPMIRVSDIKFGKIRTSTVFHISPSINELHKRTILNGDEVLVTLVGNPGATVVITDEFKGWNVARAIGVLKLKDSSEKKYLSYSLNTPYSKFLIDSFLNTTVQPTLNLGDLKRVQIPWPDKNVRSSIAEVLSSLDDKIDLLHRNNKTLERLAETLFRQWFVEEVDDSWRSGTLNDIMTIHNGRSRPNSIGNIPIYGGNGILGYSNDYNYTGKSIIIGRVGAYCGSLYYETNPIWVSDNALMVKPKEHNHTFYLFFLLRSLDLNSMAEGSSHPLLTQTLLRSIEIIIPSNSKIELFEKYVETWFEKIINNTAQICQLESLRDLLLPKLMCGQVLVN